MSKFPINQHYFVGLFFFVIIATTTLIYIHGLSVRTDRLLFLAVGQGDATLFEAANGARVLIDGGPDNIVEKKLNQNIPWWDRHINAVVITHSHLDHIGGLENVMQNFQVDNLYMAQNIETTPVLDSLVAAAKIKKIPIWLLGQNYQLNLGSSTYLQLFVDLNEQSSNEQAVVALLSNHGARVIFLADIGADQEKKLIAKLPDLQLEILKIGHHGSDLSTSAEMLDAWQPQKAVISVGRNNTFGHPSHRVLKRLERQGIMMGRTDEQGDIVYRFDNEHWQLEKR